MLISGIYIQYMYIICRSMHIFSFFSSLRLLKYLKSCSLLTTYLVPKDILCRKSISKIFDDSCVTTVEIMSIPIISTETILFRNIYFIENILTFLGWSQLWSAASATSYNFALTVLPRKSATNAWSPAARSPTTAFEGFYPLWFGSPTAAFEGV